MYSQVRVSCEFADTLYETAQVMNVFTGACVMRV